MKLPTIAIVAVLTVSSAVAQQQPDFQNMLNALQGLSAASASNSAAVVNFRELKKLLPASVAGIKRTRAEGQKQSTMGITVSYAEAEYANDGASITVKITDTTGTGFMAIGAAAITMTEIDSESDDGFERTATLQGYKGVEKYNSAAKSGEIQIWVAGRFMVEVSGNGVTFESLSKAVAALDLKALAAIMPN